MLTCLVRVQTVSFRGVTTHVSWLDAVFRFSKIRVEKKNQEIWKQI